MGLSILSLQETGTGWLWPMLPLKASSYGWSWFIRPIALARDVPFPTVGSFLDDPKRLVLVGDWNAIPDPKEGWGASESGRCESCLIVLPSLAGCWKFNISLLEIGDFQNC